MGMMLVTLHLLPGKEQCTIVSGPLQFVYTGRREVLNTLLTENHWEDLKEVLGAMGIPYEFTIGQKYDPNAKALTDDSGSNP